MKDDRKSDSRNSTPQFGNMFSRMLSILAVTIDKTLPSPLHRSLDAFRPRE